MMAADIEATDGPEPTPLRAVALPMNDDVAQMLVGARPLLRIVRPDETSLAIARIIDIFVYFDLCL